LYNSCGVAFIPRNINSAIELRAGKSLLPGDYVGVGYHQPTNLPFTFSVGAFLERSRVHSLHYSSYGAEALLELRSSVLRFCAGSMVQYEEEAWVYPDRSFTQKLNYGLVAEVGAELYLTDAFSLIAFANQRFLFNTALGKTHFVFGVGIKYSFNNY
jgi:hypothetical protein